MKKKTSTNANLKLKKLIAAISQKRRELGLPERGKLPIEEVIKRLREGQPTQDPAKSASALLSRDQGDSANPRKTGPASGRGVSKTAKPNVEASRRRARLRRSR